MIPGFVLALREGLEAALIIGIVIGALKKIHKQQFLPAVWAGAAGAMVVSAAAAVLLYRLDASFEGAAEQIFEGVTMLAAAAVLTWMIFWMNRQSRGMRQDIESGVRSAALTGGASALFFLAFTAVLREGIELALFLTAAVAASDGQFVLWGGLLGLAAAALLGYGLFASLVRLDLRRFFQVTSILLILFAAGLVAHGVHEFNEVGWIPGVVEHVWDVNFLLPESSPAGQIMTALFGYNANPSLTEAVAYGLYFGLLTLIAWQFNRKPLVQSAA